MADQYLEHTDIEIDYIGSGATVQAELFEAVGNTKVKDLGTAFATVEGVAGTKLVNTETSAGSDFIAAGINHVLKLNDGNFPAVAATPNPIEIIAPNLVDYPTIPWYNSGSVFHAANLVYNDAAGTIPATLYSTDTVRGVVGKLDRYDLSGAPENPIQMTLTQATTANKPRLELDGDGYLRMLTTPTATVPPGLLLNTDGNVSITNESIVETTITCVIGNSGVVQASNSILTFNTLARTSDGVNVTLAGSPVAGSVVLPGAVGQKLVIRERLSSGVGFGDSKVFVNDVEVSSVATYFPTINIDGITLWKRFNSFGGVDLRIYGATLYREGELTPAQAGLVYQWHKDIAGIA